MSFNLDHLDALDYEEAEHQLEAYINELMHQFAQSPEGEAYRQQFSDTGGWTSSFLDLGYRYEGVTPTTITVGDVELLMEDLLPRKITIMDASEVEDAVPKLMAFWTFFQREYQLPHAPVVIQYLQSIKGKFAHWMVDPQRAGMAKSFMMGGMQAGFDMSTQKGLHAFQAAYNTQMLGAMQASRQGHALKSNPAKKKAKVKLKGFGHAVKAKSSRRKKK